LRPIRRSASVFLTAASAGRTEKFLQACNVLSAVVGACAPVQSRRPGNGRPNVPERNFMTDQNSPPLPAREVARKRANDHFQAWEDRTTLVKQALAAERAASEAKTARLRALRLAKEAEDREAGRLAAENAPAPTKRNKRRR
jgi:hypothetical protein